MSKIEKNGGGAAATHVADVFEVDAIGAPFKVVLHKSVEVTLDEQGSMVDYKIPDLDGLLRAAALSRILHPRKLTGRDIKFLRKALGIKQKELARSIEVSPEYMSRCEAGALVLSPQSEKLLRIFILKVVVKFHRMGVGRDRQKIEDMLDALFEKIDPISAHVADEVLEFHFSRSPKRVTKISDKEVYSANDDFADWSEAKVCA